MPASHEEEGQHHSTTLSRGQAMAKWLPGCHSHNRVKNEIDKQSNKMPASMKNVIVWYAVLSACLMVEAWVSEQPLIAQY